MVLSFKLHTSQTLSWQIHGAFMWRSLKLQNGQYHIHIGSIMVDSWQIHGAFMADSWHFP